ncbi:hypothetical protein B0H16DRAFT_1449947 [Mycena metata]|uniref:Uncharacterized protein n=1 Tax=Mycena metata TaxID=1033252 RepID=A0AAD7JZY2_9AGAR|nr:hypothetical protein B0H16DRAFT_1449947 [Mycena metata]
MTSVGAACKTNKPGYCGKRSVEPFPGIDTVFDMLQYVAKTHGTRDALGWRDIVNVHEEAKEVTKTVDEKEVKETKKWNYVQLQEQVEEMARGLVDLGLTTDDVLNIYAATRWVFSLPRRVGNVLRRGRAAATQGFAYISWAQFSGQTGGCTLLNVEKKSNECTATSLPPELAKQNNRANQATDAQSVKPVCAKHESEQTYKFHDLEPHIEALQIQANICRQLIRSARKGGPRRGWTIWETTLLETSFRTTDKGFQPDTICTSHSNPRESAIQASGTQSAKPVGKKHYSETTYEFPGLALSIETLQMQAKHSLPAVQLYRVYGFVKNTIANNMLNFQAGSIHAGPRGPHKYFRAAWNPTESMDSTNLQGTTKPEASHPVKGFKE